MAKRLREFDVSEAEEEPHAKIHGVVIEVSPVKSGRNNPSSTSAVNYPMVKR